eukprot:15480916-Alexandrium_andersonii.AAC.2
MHTTDLTSRSAGPCKHGMCQNEGERNLRNVPMRMFACAGTAMPPLGRAAAADDLINHDPMHVLSCHLPEDPKRIRVSHQEHVDQT